MKPGMWVLLAVLGSFTCAAALLVWASQLPHAPVAPVVAQTVRATPVVPAQLVLVGEPVEAKTGFGSRQLVGRVQNTDTVARSGRLQITLFDASGKATGTVDAYVMHVPAGGGATYDPLLGDAVPPWARLEVRIVSQLRD